MDTTMSDQPDPREAQIAALEAALRLPLPESTLAQIAQDLRALREAAAPTITSPHAERDVNIATNQAITYLSTIIYGPDPSVAQSEQLTRYLCRLSAKLQRLPLHSLAARLDNAEGLALPKVYTALATVSQVKLGEVNEVIEVESSVAQDLLLLLITFPRHSEIISSQKPEI